MNEEKGISGVPESKLESQQVTDLENFAKKLGYLYASRNLSKIVSESVNPCFAIVQFIYDRKKEGLESKFNTPISMSDLPDEIRNFNVQISTELRGDSREDLDSILENKLLKIFEELKLNEQEKVLLDKNIFHSFNVGVSGVMHDLDYTVRTFISSLKKFNEKIKKLNSGEIESIVLQDFWGISSYIRNLYLTNSREYLEYEQSKDLAGLIPNVLPSVNFLDLSLLESGLDVSWVNRLSSLISYPIAKGEIERFDEKFGNPVLNVIGKISATKLGFTNETQPKIFSYLIEELLQFTYKATTKREEGQKQEVDVNINEEAIVIEIKGYGRFNEDDANYNSLLCFLPQWSLDISQNNGIFQIILTKK